MEQNKILTHVYIVEVESKEQDKDNSNDVCDIHSGVLRVFANKEDASAYMREYYDKCELTSKSIETFESGNGGFQLKQIPEVKTFLVLYLKIQWRVLADEDNKNIQDALGI